MNIYIIEYVGNYALEVVVVQAVSQHEALEHAPKLSEPFNGMRVTCVDHEKVGIVYTAGYIE